MKYHLIALFTVFVWGVTFVSTKVLLADFTPLWILALRFAVGFLALCALRPHMLRLANRRHELLFIAAGATGIAAYYLLENVALVFTTATATGVIVAASPLFTALLQAARGDRSALSPRFLAGFVMAMAGLAIVGMGSTSAGAGAEAAASAVGGVSSAIASSSPDFAADTGALGGDLLALEAALVWAVYSLLVKRIADLGYETVASTKRTFLWGLVFIVPATAAFGSPIPAAGAIIEPVNLANLLFLGAVASAACFVTWGIAVKRLGAVTSTTYIYLVPAITAAASIAVLGEPLNAAIVVGIGLTIAGLVLSQWQPTAKHEDDLGDATTPTSCAEAEQEAEGA